MKEYHQLVLNALQEGTHKPNRTGVDTISTFHESYEIDLSDGYPLLTTKKMDGYRWDSMLHEFVWYLSGEEHIRNLRENTKIWNAWADENGHLDTAYGRFWRRFPVPDGTDALDGESWAGQTETKWDDSDDIDPSRWLSEEQTGDGETRTVFDQVQYALDLLEGSPSSRRIVINAWHPANAAVSTLPPCHFTFVFNVQGDGTLNVHLTQRSGDIALGVPFNIACYSLLANVVAQRTDLELGNFAHSITDAHIYCGKGARGEWYESNLTEVQDRLSRVDTDENYSDVADWVEEEAPDDPENYDHVPGLLRQLSRTPKERPEIEVADKPVDELTYDDIHLHKYNSHDGLKFGVAE